MLSRCASVLVLAFCLFVFGRGTTLAQSLDLSGAENQWFYGYYGQLGSRGFFGDYNVDASSTGGNFASLNAWVGNRPFPDIGFLVSGTNASLSSLSLAITPRYGNEWVILKARYNINAYNTGTAPGALVPISPGQLTLWSVQVNSPVASIRFGKQIFQKGFNLQFSNNRTTEYLMLEQRFCVPDILGCLVGAGFLPKGVMSWFNPHLWPRYKKGVTANPEDELFGDPQTGKSIFAQRDEAQKKDPFFAEGVLAETPEETERKKHWPTDDDAYAWSYIGPGCMRIGLGTFAWEQPDPLNLVLWNNSDTGALRAQNYIGLIAYSSKDLEFGVGCLRSNYHQGPELAPGLVARVSTPTFERYITEGWAYLKYNNGRFFFNTELDWFNRVYRFQRSLDGTFFGQPENTDGSGSVFRSQYWESWRYMLEAGVGYGPLVARVFYCFMPGPDRRHGVLIDRQPFIQENPQQAFGLFDPYSILLAYRFGSGVNAPGHISDASIYAVKLDYALAANLIVEGSFLQAFRNSNGYAVGFVRPNLTAAGFGSVVYAEPPGSTFTNPAPSVPNRDLGWEAMAGVVWQLLDGWAVAGRVSYWKPGKWFNYACIDKGVPNWDIPSAANNWGINPDRTIDPVLAFEIQLGASY
ncbi:MAG: hypothetical protein HY913_10145 [Desulfomonile tiedjei]|nr:hypothetical protein [Desulfomonile tiedjei]